jgi:hypothetical protein
MPPLHCGWSGRGRGTTAETVTHTGARSVRAWSLGGTEMDCRAGGEPHLPQCCP